MPNHRQYFHLIAAVFAVMILVCSCDRDPAVVQKENDFLDKIDQLVTELGPTLPDSWKKPSICSDKYIIWERYDHGQFSTRQSGYLGFKDWQVGLPTAKPLWEARSLIIFEDGAEFDSPSSSAPLPWYGSGTPRAWIVDIRTKEIFGYFQGRTRQLTLKKIHPWDDTARRVSDDGNEYRPDLEFKNWFSSVPKITNQTISDEKLVENSSLPKSATISSDSRDISLGKFTLKVPTEWASFDSSEAASLNQQYAEQRQQIYQQYSGSADDAKTVDIAGFHIRNDAGAFIMVSFSVPEQANLISTLKSQIEQKMDWGVQNGYIRKYLGLVPIDDENFSGFYTKAIGKDGGIEVSGGLEHKKLKNTVIQLTLLCPQDWDEGKATNTLATVLKSLVLTAK
jgi:hypothetical protein